MILFNHRIGFRSKLRLGFIPTKRAKVHLGGVLFVAHPKGAVLKLFADVDGLAAG